MATFEILAPCRVCQDPVAAAEFEHLFNAGHGYRHIWHVAMAKRGIGKHQCQRHATELRTGTTDIISDNPHPFRSINEAEDKAVQVPDIRSYLEARGIELPPEGWTVPVATIEERSPDGERRHWVRIRPEQDENEEHCEIRQAQPLTIEGPRPCPVFWIKNDWKTWICTPDLQTGYWVDAYGNFHTIHDERAIDLTEQVALAVAQDEGAYGWLDVGDTADSAAVSSHHPGALDLHVQTTNLAMQRLSEIMARRRFIIGDEGPLVVTLGNHELRWGKMAQQQMPMLVGLRRAGDPEDEHPVLSVPYLARFRDYNITTVASYPSAYYIVNDNLVAFHAPAYGSRALDTARKIATLIHCSTVFGHTHRRESFSLVIDAVGKTRTMEIWSDGTLARTDGSVPSARSTYDTSMNRVTQSDLPEGMGVLGEAWQQGFSVLHVERSGRQRFSREPVVIWDGWCQFRGQTFEASVDIEGKPIAVNHPSLKGGA